ncbi:MAG TPA: membrane or secreted protein [Planctomycetaceae bacterium]|nr:membrane or secreted protein [Planctomycetaceae bacterium]
MTAHNSATTHPAQACSARTICLAVAISVSAAVNAISPLSPKTAAADDYKPAISLVPDTAAGILRIPSVPTLCDAWKTTTLSAMVNDPSMKPFVDAQKKLSEERTSTLGFNIGVRPKEVLEIASGEVVVAWLPFDDLRRPFALALVADIRGNRARADQVVAKIDADMKANGAKLQMTSFGSEPIRVYTLKPVPGQIKIDQVVLTYNDTRLIAADRDSVVTSMLESVAGTNKIAKLETAEDFLGVRKQIETPVAENTPMAGVQWFARPLAMGRIVKEAAKIDRGRQVDILNLLQRQGFDAVRAAGGQVSVGSPEFDLMHKGFIWAPSVPGQAERFRLAARAIQPINLPAESIPAWVGSKIASFSQLNWNMSDAFWHVESLVDDAFGEVIFRDILEGIRDDEDGPRIDIAKDVIPNLGKRLFILTDNVMPADQRSERLLVAIETSDTAALRKAVRRTMEVESDASLIPGPIPGVDVYRVLRTNEPNDFEAELFDDLGLGDDENDPNRQPPLLNQWAITVIDAPGAANTGKQSGYLIFSSHPELLLETLGRFAKTGSADAFGDDAEVKVVLNKLEKMGAQQRAYVRVARTNLTFRAKYGLMQEGKLRESDSVMATLFRRIFISKGEEDIDLNNDKLPPFEKIEKYLRPAGGFSQATETGWTLDGFLLK